MIQLIVNCILASLVITNVNALTGCSDISTAREVVYSAIYACPGTFDSGGTYGANAAALCNAGYHVCDSAAEAASLGLTDDLCRNNVAINDMEFFGTKETSYGNWECESQHGNANKIYNDIWGCARSTANTLNVMNNDANCMVNGQVIFDSAMGGTNWYSWDITTYCSSPCYDEAIAYRLTDSVNGGVLCCADRDVVGGDGFIQLGAFRIGNVDDTHFSISSISGTAGAKTAVVFKNDGTTHPGPRTDFNFNDKPLLSVPQNVTFTNNGIEFGDYWCLGLSGLNQYNHSYLSITHNNNNGDGIAKTAMIWKEDGTRHIGPTTNFSCWSSSVDNVVTVALDQSYIQFNDIFRIGTKGLSNDYHQSLSIASKKTVVFYWDDGTIHPGPRDDWAWPVGGDGFIQLGTFRIGNVDDTHFSISSISGTAGPKTAVIFRNNGTQYSGPRTDFNFNDKPLLTFPKNVVFTNNGIIFGDYWCLGLIYFQKYHLSITHNNNHENGDGVAKTAMIWREDGTIYGGPRTDFSCWSTNIDNYVTISSDKSFIQFNDAFRIGTTGLDDDNHQCLSIASVRTAVVYTDVGTIKYGPRDDFGFTWTPSIVSAARREPIRMNDLFENNGNNEIEYGLYDENDNYGKQLYSNENENEDKILIGLVLIVIIMTMINCYICSKKTNNKKYQIVNMQESTDDEHV